VHLVTIRIPEPPGVRAIEEARRRGRGRPIRDAAWERGVEGVGLVFTASALN